MQDATQLFEQNTGLVGYIARHLYEIALPRGYFVIDDLYQEGCIGLWKACKTFKPEKGWKFSTYAGTCIRNEILMYLRKNGRHVDMVTLDSRLPEQNEDTDTTFKDMLPSNANVESDILTEELKRFYDNELNLKNMKKRSDHVEVREKRVYELMMKGYKQCEMIPFIGVSQRILAMDMAHIRERVKDGWVTN